MPDHVLKRTQPNNYLISALSGVATLFVLNLLVAPTFVAPASELQAKLSELLIMDQEANLPTLFNYGLIVLNAFFLASIALQQFNDGTRWRWHWAALCTIFALLSYDEAASVHERFAAIGGLLVEAKGAFRFTWIVPVVPVVALIGLGFVNFLRHQPGWLSGLMVLSGGVFLFGAVGMEMVGAANFDAYGTLDRVGYHLIAGIEESLEMCGMALFGYTLLTVINDEQRASQAGAYAMIAAE